MAKFLNKLLRPKIWDGYPFLISVVVASEDFLKLIVEGYASDGSLLATQENDVGQYENKVVDFNVSEIYGSLDGVAYLNIYVESNLVDDPTEILTIDVISPCSNPVYLLGRNSLGGVLQWLFDGSQDYTPDFSNDIKANRLILFSESLSINEWESLQDFITLGEVYRNNIIEFDSSVIKTSTRVGQQIYVVDEDGNKTGVIAIPTKNRTATRQIKHKFEIEIEYPEVFV